MTKSKDPWKGTECFNDEKMCLKHIDSEQWRDFIRQEAETANNWQNSQHRYQSTVHMGGRSRSVTHGPKYHKEPYHKAVEKGEAYVMPPRHFRSNFSEGGYRQYAQVPLLLLTGSTVW